MSKFNWWKAPCGVVVLCVVTAIGARAQTFTSLYSFCAQTNCTDGANPDAGLIQAADGNLYGTTLYGGASGSYGTVFRIAFTGNLTTGHRFCSQSGCADGASPDTALIQASDGNFYGTTSSGGAYGIYGAIFKIAPSGKLTTLYSFDDVDGANPNGPLLQASNGSFYGTTVSGGAYGYGTIFKITAAGTLTTLHSFDSTDGSYPYAALVQGTDGSFYGTTSSGGAANSSCVFGCGTVFKMTSDGTLTTLHSFDATDGAAPYAALVQAADDNFYGTTETRGAYDYGTVFEITPEGTVTTLHSFDSTDGALPFATLVLATDGNLYGTTTYGGTNNDGTIFEITPSGTLTTVHAFAGPDGVNPEAALVEATNGIFYGTTYGSGANDTCRDGCGTLFSVSVGLGPFVKTVPTSGNTGGAVRILGTNLTGSTGVTFNGTAAVFTIVSPTEIATTVPTGATTGTVEVVTPSGTLTSNVPFRVIP